MSVLGLRITIKGKVQGVYFRKFVQEKANLLGLSGTVRNITDGSVLCEVVGPALTLERFVEYCRKGPSASIVHEILYEEIPRIDFDGFKILSTKSR